MRSSDRVYEVLHREILEGDLAPGAVLAEIEQSQRLGVSRTPLREALARLSADGLVSASGGRGVAVTPVSREHVLDLFELREALEVRAARLAAQRRDAAVFVALREDFARAGDLLGDGDVLRHGFYEQTSRLDEAIDVAAANPYLVGALRGVRAHVARIRRLSRDDPDRLRSATQEHIAIIDAIIEGSERFAAHATELHLHRSLASILAAVDATTGAAGRPEPAHSA